MPLDRIGNVATVNPQTYQSADFILDDGLFPTAVAFALGTLNATFDGMTLAAQGEVVQPSLDFDVIRFGKAIDAVLFESGQIRILFPQAVNQVEV